MPLALDIGLFVAGALVTMVAGARLSRLGDVLADRLGWGEALFGAVFFGAVTSLSGIVMTATAAYEGHGGLAYSNAVGGVAAQTLALAVADIAYRRANLEHAAASLSNIFFGVLLIALLALVVLGGLLPEVDVWGIHPLSIGLLLVYLGGLKLSRDVKQTPLWRPIETGETREDEPAEEGRERALAKDVAEFAAVGLLVASTGWLIARSASAIVEATGLGETVVGALLMGITNALPETITAIAAVRQGALTLAMAGVLGGNAFDALNVAVGDVFFRDGSLYHRATPDEVTFTLVSLLMTAAVIAGLVRRQEQGLGGIGFESWTIIALYGGGVAALFV